jgi:hypothetical protein
MFVCSKKREASAKNNSEIIIAASGTCHEEAISFWVGTMCNSRALSPPSVLGLFDKQINITLATKLRKID